MTDLVAHAPALALFLLLDPAVDGVLERVVGRSLAGLLWVLGWERQFLLARRHPC